MKVLISGCSGYIGSLLTEYLINSNKFFPLEIVGIDNLRYDQGPFIPYLWKNIPNFTFLHRDAFDINLKRVYDECDIIIPLCAIVGAPACDFYTHAAKRINLDYIEWLCEIVREDQYIIFPTTNSGYGISEGVCTEESPLNPITYYGQLKSKAETIVLQRKNSTVFRLATVFGVSYRHRLDLLVNHLTYESCKNLRLEIYEGHFRRNFIHVHDVIRAFEFAIMMMIDDKIYLGTALNKLMDKVFNLGLDEANMTKMQLAQRIKKHIPHLEINECSGKDPDQRDYLVSNQKILNAGFRTKTSLDFGIKELIRFYNLLEPAHTALMSRTMFNCPQGKQK